MRVSQRSGALPGALPQCHALWPDSSCSLAYRRSGHRGRRGPQRCGRGAKQQQPAAGGTPAAQGVQARCVGVGGRMRVGCGHARGVRRRHALVVWIESVARRKRESACRSSGHATQFSKAPFVPAPSDGADAAAAAGSGSNKKRKSGDTTRLTPRARQKSGGQAGSRVALLVRVQCTHSSLAPRSTSCPRSQMRRLRRLPPPRRGRPRPQQARAQAPARTSRAPWWRGGRSRGSSKVGGSGRVHRRAGNGTGSTLGRSHSAMAASSKD